MAGRASRLMAGHPLSDQQRTRAALNPENCAPHPKYSRKPVEETVYQQREPCRHGSRVANNTGDVARCRLRSGGEQRSQSRQVASSRYQPLHSQRALAPRTPIVMSGPALSTVARKGPTVSINEFIAISSKRLPPTLPSECLTTSTPPAQNLMQLQGSRKKAALSMKGNRS